MTLRSAPGKKRHCTGFHDPVPSGISWVGPPRERGAAAGPRALTAKRFPSTLTACHDMTAVPTTNSAR